MILHKQIGQKTPQGLEGSGKPNQVELNGGYKEPLFGKLFTAIRNALADQTEEKSSPKQNPGALVNDEGKKGPKTICQPSQTTDGKTNSGLMLDKISAQQSHVPEKGNENKQLPISISGEVEQSQSKDLTDQKNIVENSVMQGSSHVAKKSPSLVAPVNSNDSAAPSVPVISQAHESQHGEQTNENSKNTQYSGRASKAPEEMVSSPEKGQLNSPELSKAQLKNKSESVLAEGINKNGNNAPQRSEIQESPTQSENLNFTAAPETNMPAGENVTTQTGPTNGVDERVSEEKLSSLKTATDTKGDSQEKLKTGADRADTRLAGSGTAHTTSDSKSSVKGQHVIHTGNSNQVMVEADPLQPNVNKNESLTGSTNTKYSEAASSKVAGQQMTGDANRIDVETYKGQLLHDKSKVYTAKASSAADARFVKGDVRHLSNLKNETNANVTSQNGNITGQQNRESVTSGFAHNNGDIAAKIAVSQSSPSANLVTNKQKKSNSINSESPFINRPIREKESMGHALNLETSGNRQESVISGVQSDRRIIVGSTNGVQNTGPSGDKGIIVNTVEENVDVIREELRQSSDEAHNKYISSFANRSQLFSQQSATARPQVNAAFSGQSLLNSSYTGASQSQQSSEAGATDKGSEMFWKEHFAELQNGDEGKGLERQRMNMMRLNQLPVTNISIRRDIIPGLSKIVQEAVSGNKSADQPWQKHNFVLDEGKNIQLSTRQVDGVLQLKLSSSHVELSRLLQQHQQEIKEHLEQKCGVQIDLEFENSEEQETSNFLEQSSNSNQSIHRRSGRIAAGRQEETNGSPLLNRIRKFGYNQMEWTA